jgi:hypothetical protein
MSPISLTEAKAMRIDFRYDVRPESKKKFVHGTYLGAPEPRRPTL